MLMCQGSPIAHASLSPSCYTCHCPPPPPFPLSAPNCWPPGEGPPHLLSQPEELLHLIRFPCSFLPAGPVTSMSRRSMHYSSLCARPPLPTRPLPPPHTHNGLIPVLTAHLAPPPARRPSPVSANSQSCGHEPNILRGACSGAHLLPLWVLARAPHADGDVARCLYTFRN